MPFYILDERSGLLDYYRVFAISWPLIFLVPFFVVLKVVLHLSSGAFIDLYLSCSGTAVLLGAPLFYWSHKRSRFTQNARPIILATGVTVLLSTAPLFCYFFSRIHEFEILPVAEALCVVVVPWIILCIKPPAKLNEKLRDARADRRSY